MMRIKVVLSLLVLASPFFGYAIERISPKTLADAEKYTSDELIGYHQEKYQLVDPAGDYALLMRTQRVPRRILSKLHLGSIPAQRVSFEEDYDDEPLSEVAQDPQGLKDDVKISAYCKRHPEEVSIFKSICKSLESVSDQDAEQKRLILRNIETPIQGRANPINREGFRRMFAEIINEERQKGIEPSLGEPHRWSKEFLDQYRGTSMMLGSSKLLMALAMGETNRYMRTDREADLYRWMVQQEDASLMIPEVFRKSYQLNAGDVYKTILTIENVLGHRWRDPMRDRFPLTQKLHPITSGHEYQADRYGTWYHFFGIMLYGYIKGGVKSQAIGWVEALGSRVLSPGVNKSQKALINENGGAVGSDLADMVLSRSYLEQKESQEYLAEDAYLNRKEDFRDRISVPLSRELVIEFDKRRERSFVSVSSPGLELTNCLIEIMPDVGKGFDSSIKDEIRADRVANEPVVVQVFSKNVQKIRGFVSCDNLDATLAFEADR